MDDLSMELELADEDELVLWAWYIFFLPKQPLICPIDIEWGNPSFTSHLLERRNSCFEIRNLSMQKSQSYKTALKTAKRP